VENFATGLRTFATPSSEQLKYNGTIYTYFRKCDAKSIYFNTSAYRGSVLLLYKSSVRFHSATCIIAFFRIDIANKSGEQIRRKENPLAGNPDEQVWIKNAGFEA
jgi:hypothetical protein